jgi:hypothetical protein
MQIMSYNLEAINNITFGGFDITLPDETLSIITELAQQVGSPTYVKTPTFIKKDLLEKATIFTSASSGSGDFRKKRKGKANEVLNDEDWESIRTFQATVIEQKVGIDAQIDLIRSALNKMTDKTYIDSVAKISSILDDLIRGGTSEADMLRIGNAVFEIASNNRFFSKLYADLFTVLLQNYQVMQGVFEKIFDTFLDIFQNIESASPEKDYDLYCKVNKNNERRKALSAFFVNLTTNGVINRDKLASINFHLLRQVLAYIKEADKKSEVDEMIENIAILYNKELYESCEEQIDGKSFSVIIEQLARSKAKDYPSLTNKSIFKCMDMVDM